MEVVFRLSARSFADSSFERVRPSFLDGVWPILCCGNHGDEWCCTSSRALTRSVSLCLCVWKEQSIVIASRNERDREKDKAESGNVIN